MSEVSRLYSSPDTVYRTGARSHRNRGLNGDVKHIVYKDGKPVVTEIIPISRPQEPKPTRLPKAAKPGTTRPVPDHPSGGHFRQNSQETAQRKRQKLLDRLKRAIAASETLWSAKSGIWLSYQGEHRFLVKRFTTDNRLISKQLLPLEEILAGAVPGILDTGWEKV